MANPRMSSLADSILKEDDVDLVAWVEIAKANNLLAPLDLVDLCDALELCPTHHCDMQICLDDQADGCDDARMGYCTYCQTVGHAADDCPERGIRYEIVHNRDPDAECDITLFVDGEPVPADQLDVADVDPGAGHTREDWDATTRDMVGRASAAAAELIQELRDGAADNSNYIEP